MYILPKILYLHAYKIFFFIYFLVDSSSGSGGGGLDMSALAGMMGGDHPHIQTSIRFI